MPNPPPTMTASGSSILTKKPTLLPSAAAADSMILSHRRHPGCRRRRRIEDFLSFRDSFRSNPVIALNKCRTRGKFLQYIIDPAATPMAGRAEWGTCQDQGIPPGSREGTTVQDETAADPGSHRDIGERAVVAASSEQGLAQGRRPNVRFHDCWSQLGTDGLNRDILPGEGLAARNVALGIDCFGDTDTDSAHGGGDSPCFREEGSRKFQQIVEHGLRAAFRPGGHHPLAEHLSGITDHQAARDLCASDVEPNHAGRSGFGIV